jgi:NTE family protein
MSTANSKTVSLVLGSGGARGLAHIGVIHWLEENDFKIKSIVGCSIGAVIGGIYAAGKLDVYEQWVRALTKVDIVTLLDLSWDKSGLVRGDKLVNTLRNLVGEKLIEDLPISFTAVASDLRSQKEVWIRSGSLFDAMRASFAIPLFFTPFKLNGVDLVDGGVLNPVPIAPTSCDGTDITIAVDLNGSGESPIEPAEVSAAP